MFRNNYSRTFILKHNGFTLPEILVALFIALLIGSAVLKWLAVNRRLSYVSQVYMQLSLNARVVQKTLQDHIQGSRLSASCSANTINEYWVTTLSTLPVVRLSIEQLPKVWQQRALVGSDVLLVQGAQEEYFNYHYDPAQADQIMLTADAPFKAGDLLQLVSCERAIVVRCQTVSHVRNQTIITFEQTLPAANRVARFHSTLYFIADTRRLNSQQQKVFSLYAYDAESNEEEIVEDVYGFSSKLSTSKITLAFLLCSHDKVMEGRLCKKFNMDVEI